MKLTSQQINAFQNKLFTYYDANGRHELPWRKPEDDGSYDPYKILVSELMLQQTQVARVVTKFEQFIQKFPEVQTLAAAELGDVLIEWQGLGYNRRAKYLWQASRQVASAGLFPNHIDDLVALPGVGKNTAGAIMVYAYNQPALFVETNIRTVYINEFLEEIDQVSDAQIIDLVAQTISPTNTREFYWALMDYGTNLKQQGKSGIQKSKHYVKQSTFAGSNRQIRGQVIRMLTQGPTSLGTLLETINDARLYDVLKKLEDEGLITLKAGTYFLA